MVFRLEADEWVDEAGSKVADAELLSSLNATHAAKRHWRPQKSARAYFPVTKYDAIVEATFSNPPRAATRQRFADNVERCVQHSTQAFDADHDLLTGLMNRRRLESEIDAAFASQSSVDPPESVGSLRTASGAPVWLLALDIDHFKQINDTHGHLYGDIVLACFAERVRRVVAAFAAQRTTIAAHVARTGGEEFLVVLVRVEQTDASALAEDIRSVISREPLPSDAEWAALPNRSRVIPLPHASERKVTVSIGCTGVVKATGGDIQELVGRVEAEADTALYRAKASGRDTVRWFSEIVQRGGRVLEHHADTDIVAVDIGRNVGVRVGQEFFVFHPDFAGGTPFLFSDGRSKKKLGSYPKVAMGRVIAFEVQLEQRSAWKSHDSHCLHADDRQGPSGRDLLRSARAGARDGGDGHGAVASEARGDAAGAVHPQAA
jgi:diguanylate cyclase (GGDEF)-like protein